MFSTRSFVAVTVSLGLSLSACVSEPDIDSDIAGEAPEMQPMNGGQGYNGGLPTAVGPCMKGIALAAASVPGIDPNDEKQLRLNPLLSKFRCAGYTDAAPYTAADLAADAPNDYVNRPLNVALPNSENDVIESMVWAGVTRDVEIDYTDPLATQPPLNQAHPYFGRGFLATPWETTPIQTNAGLGDFVALMTAKMNAWSTPIPIYVESERIVAEDPQGEYNVLESVIASNYRVVNGVVHGEILFFKAPLAEDECNNQAEYYDKRTCHNANAYCIPGLDVLTEADLPTYCTLKDGGTPQSLLDKGLECMGQPVFRVWVPSGALKSVPGSPCVF